MEINTWWGIISWNTLWLANGTNDHKSLTMLINANVFKITRRDYSLTVTTKNLNALASIVNVAIVRIN